jgi:ATP-dependent RNA helicase DDX46/PRP5
VQKLELEEEKKVDDSAAALYVHTCQGRQSRDNLTKDILNRLAAANKNKKVLEQVDHSKMDYIPFRKEFYIEVPEIAKMTDEEVAAYREQLEDIKIRVR